MNPINPIRRYRIEPRWLLENLAYVHAGKGPLRLCWWRGTTCFVVNMATRQYRQLSDWSNILADNENVPFHTSLRCKRNGVRGCLTVHYTDNDGRDGVLKIDEELNITSKRNR